MDMVTMNIIDSTMVSICREMGILLMKTSYSTIFNEGLDFTCALADDKGDMIACAEFCPTMIGGMPLLIKTCAQEIPFDTIEDGDVILHNDPYRGRPALPGAYLLQAVLRRRRASGLRGVHRPHRRDRRHGAGRVRRRGHRDLPRGHPRAADQDQEEGRGRRRGLEAAARQRAHAAPELRRSARHDRLGRPRRATRDRAGQEVWQGGVQADLRRSHGLFRAADARRDRPLSRWPLRLRGCDRERRHRGRSLLRPGRRVRAGRRGGGRLLAQLEAGQGTRQRDARRHDGRHLQRAASSADPSIPKNSGCFRPIRVVSPPGLVTNVDYPAPEVAGNTETHPRLANIVIGALSACVPERAMASESCTGTNFVFGGNHPDHDEYFACYDLMSGGWGGRFGHDGNDCVIAINGNCRFNPTEVFETRFPLRVEDCELVQDSGGPGKYRGGLGYRRTLLATQVEINGSQCSDRHVVKPWALFDGQPGGNGATVIQKAGSDRWQTVKELYHKVSSSKYANIKLQPGDRIRLTTPGGGGYGDPREREAWRIEEDLREGYVSDASAGRDYGRPAPERR